MVNVGIVGLARIATQFHIPSLLRIKESQIKGICARTQTKERLSLASDIGANFYQDYREMYEREKLEELEEERRMFYVACTRAKRGLYLTMPSYMSSCDSFFTLSSRFLAEIEKTNYEVLK